MLFLLSLYVFSVIFTFILDAPSRPAPPAGGPVAKEDAENNLKMQLMGNFIT